MNLRPASASPPRFETLRFALLAALHSPHLPGVAVLALTLLILSAGAGMQPDHHARLFMAGEIATSDVVADRNLQVEDPKATKARREQLASIQPTAFDLSGAEVTRLRQRLFDIFYLVNADGPGLHPGGSGGFAAPDKQPSEETEKAAPEKAARDAQAAGDAQAGAAEEAVMWRLYELSGVLFSPETLRTLTNPALQAYMTEKGLPWLEARLQEGVVDDTRILRATSGGVLIRNMDTGQEFLRPSSDDIRDLSSLLALFSQHMRANSDLDQPERRVLNQLATALIMPTLTINREATQALGAMIGQNAEPVYYRISKGEVIVYQGERVSWEQQLKLQGLFRKGKTFLRAPETIGAFGIGLFLAIGLFITPGGKVSSPLRRRDLLFISCLLLVFGLAAKGLSLAGPRVLEGSALAVLPFVFPVTAPAGLAALIFASRRYCVTGLLVSMYTTLLFGGDIALFLFYFGSAMSNTWLILRAQNRQDVVRSVLPLGAVMLPLGFAAAMLEGFPLADGPILVMYLAISVILAQFAMFAISPLLEMGFSYTTRFRLMELLNLEQPLLRDLMMAAPGTYHHSLVVSNMVEAGANAVGANSLLCKVGALYHDIGKLSYPDYFIENQFGGPNRHDKLAPAMSALILVSHVKKGVEMAHKYNLGEEIEDVIRQHHGTNLMAYFYRKAQEQGQGEAPRIEDFRYPGPCPQSREAAIVLAADIVEASSRTLSDPTPARIKTHIDTMLRKIFADGQFDDSALTFQDLRKLAESFGRILTGLFHQRIAYPDAHKGKVPSPGDNPARTGAPGGAALRPETDAAGVSPARTQGVPGGEAPRPETDAVGLSPARTQGDPGGEAPRPETDAIGLSPETGAP
jgi:putative nucleotidyltransferase with HDIG domain